MVLLTWVLKSNWERREGAVNSAEPSAELESIPSNAALAQASGVEPADALEQVPRAAVAFSSKSCEPSGSGYDLTALRSLALDVQILLCRG